MNKITVIGTLLLMIFALAAAPVFAADMGNRGMSNRSEFYRSNPSATSRDYDSRSMERGNNYNQDRFYAPQQGPPQSDFNANSDWGGTFVHPGDELAFERGGEHGERFAAKEQGQYNNKKSYDSGKQYAPQVSERSDENHYVG